MGFTIQECPSCTKLENNNLEKLGFKWIDNLQVYQARYSDSYYSDVVQVKIFDWTASIYMTDIHSKWSRSLARKAITALSKQDEFPDSGDICLGETVASKFPKPPGHVPTPPPSTT